MKLISLLSVTAAFVIPASVQAYCQVPFAPTNTNDSYSMQQYYYEVEQYQRCMQQQQQQQLLQQQLQQNNLNGQGGLYGGGLYGSGLNRAGGSTAY